MPPTPNDRPTPEPVSQIFTPAVAEEDPEAERRRISDYLGDVSRLEADLATERKQNEDLRAEVLYQRRRIEREEEARLQLMQLLDNSQRLLANAQRHTQHLLGGNEAEIFAMALTEAPETPAEEAPATEAPATEAPATEAPATEAPATVAPDPPPLKPRRRWWSWG